MDIAKAQALVNEFAGHMIVDPTFIALLIMLTQADILGRAELNFIKKWVKDANKAE